MFFRHFIPLIKLDLSSTLFRLCLCFKQLTLYDAVSEWHDNQKQSSSDIRKLLQERIEKANPRRELTAEQNNRLRKL